MSSLTQEPRRRRDRAAAARDRVREAHRSGRLQDWWYDLLDVGRQPRLVRAGLRYVIAWGNLGSGGVTFTALLSLTAALTIIVNTARAFLGGRPELVAGVIDIVNSVVPGIVDDGSNDGLIGAEDLLRDGTWGWTTAISTVVILWTAITMMTGLRRTVRQMFGLGGAPLRFVRGKVIDLWGFFLLTLTIFTSSAAVSAMTLLGEDLMAWLGLRSSVAGWLLAGAALLLIAVLDALLVWLVLRVISKIRTPWADMRQGMVLGAVGFGLLRVGGASVVGAISAGPLFSTFAAVATLMLTLNLALRWLLFVAAWTANPPAAHVPVHPDTVHAKEQPNYVTLSAPHTLAWPHHQVTGSLIPEDHPRFDRQRS
ncbi:YihY/virulence factor BrkB family protein [Ornithinimicrobium kibberense]|uniref:YihY/virulence factor BrkB family protein n=1 Tax=Ornithinimicrobium kibberense TaxID=282060 RepID=A0ABV5UYD3_9MICO|nr:YihY/virulence factor BrkB family protein [Ornithinimicrobium kibberense]